MQLDWKKYSIGEINEFQAFYFDGTQEMIPLQTLQSIGYQDFSYDAMTGHTTIFGTNIMNSQRIGFLKGYVCLYLNQLYVCYLHDFEMNAKQLEYNKPTEILSIDSKELEKLQRLSQIEIDQDKKDVNFNTWMWVAIIGGYILWTCLLFTITYKLF